MRRHWVVVLLCVIVCVGLGAAGGLARHPNYTARSKLSVGHINLSAPGALSGYAQATEALATTYSRAIDAEAIVKPVAQATHLSEKTVRKRLSASPVPQSPVFRVEAIGPNAAAAVALANTAANTLVTYVTDLNRATPDSGRLFVRFQHAVAEANVHKATRQRIAKAIAASKTPSSELQTALVNSNSAIDTAELRVQALRKAYVTALEGQSSTELAQILAPATQGTSDKRRKLEITGFLGLVVGLLIGAALASLLERRRYRRAGRA
jgi:capsular polysaccharide biosynthesis protein